MKSIRELTEKEIKEILECPFKLDKKHTYKYLMNKFNNSLVVNEIMEKCKENFDEDDFSFIALK